MPSDDLHDLKYEGNIFYTEKDAKMLEELLKNPPPPNERLQNIWAKYMKMKDEHGR